MEKYTTSLEISKKLVEAGWKKQVNYYWRVCKNKKYLFRCSTWIPEKNLEYEYFPSPLTDEILEELPKEIDMYHYNNRVAVDEAMLIYKQTNKPTIDNPINFEGGKLCDNLALMWLYLKSNNLLEGGKG